MFNKTCCLISAILLIVLSSCSQKECLQGEPTAIFSPDLPEVQKHSFSVSEDKTTAEEYLLLNNGEELEVWQRGCENLRQEYRFFVKQSLTEEQKRDPYFWLATLLKRLDNLSKLGASYSIYSSYVQALAEQAENWTLGETQELGPNFYATVDVVQAQEYNILLLILSDQP